MLFNGCVAATDNHNHCGKEPIVVAAQADT
jgi:hypothetical protein